MKMNMAALLMMTALAVPASAQTNPSSASGVVVSSTTETIVVRMEDGTQRTFNVTSTTTLPSARLVEGNRVTVQYLPLDGGLFEAARVELAAAAAAITDRPVPTSTPDRSMTTEPARTMGMDPARTQNNDRTMATDSSRPMDTEPTRTSSTENRETLPSTASPMPLLALSGCVALFAGLLLSAARRTS